jgi:hypothetical protein
VLFMVEIKISSQNANRVTMAVGIQLGGSDGQTQATHTDVVGSP